LFFTSNSIVFVGGGARIFLPQAAVYPSNATASYVTDIKTKTNNNFLSLE